VKRKIRMSPPHFGVCSFAVSASNSEVLELTARLGSRLGYTGHVSLEFKWDHRDGLYKYIELNPRLPASVALDEASGVPTVWNTYRVALGEDVEPVASRQRDGVIYLMPLDDAYNRLKDGERLGAILAHYLAWSLHRRVGPHFAWHDPLPGLVHIWTFLRKPAVERYQRFRARRVPPPGPSAVD
jgi:predicted ATP-grasp superfamily ATP-dependent carboligase